MGAIHNAGDSDRQPNVAFDGSRTGPEYFDILPRTGNKSTLWKAAIEAIEPPTRHGLARRMSEYLPVALTFALTALVVAVMVSLNRLFGPRVRNAPPVKEETFECGNVSSGTAWARFSVKFYLVAILFIVFDVEVVFMYPWAVIYRDLGVFGFVEMLVFIGVLALGFLFAWRKGALEWS
jgi:NADH-quinone oxidoreductase subunit A